MGTLLGPKYIQFNAYLEPREKEGRGLEGTWWGQGVELNSER